MRELAVLSLAGGGTGLFVSAYHLYADGTISLPAYGLAGCLSVALFVIGAGLAWRWRKFLNTR